MSGATYPGQSSGSERKGGMGCLNAPEADGCMWRHNQPTSYCVRKPGDYKSAKSLTIHHSCPPSQTNGRICCVQERFPGPDQPHAIVGSSKGRCIMGALLQASYDQLSDVLYVSLGAPVPSEAEGEPDGIEL